MRTDAVLLSHWLLLACGIFLTAIWETRADYGLITLLDQTLSVREDTFWELQKQRIRSKADWITATSDSPEVARDQFQWQLNRWMTRQYAYQLAWGSIDDRQLWGVRTTVPRGSAGNTSKRSIRGNQDNLFHISTLKTLSCWFNFCFRLVGGKWQLKESRFQKKKKAYHSGVLTYE